MKVSSYLLLLLLLLSLFFLIRGEILRNYEYEQKISSYWNLSDKASTISQKAHYVDRFVKALENSNLQNTYNAIWLKTPDNSFDKNLEQLKTLQQRLHEIEKMDITSFQYQTAIQQITAQEQGEAQKMLKVFEGCWMLDNYFLLWGWIGTIVWILWTVFLVVDVILFFKAYDWQRFYS